MARCPIPFERDDPCNTRPPVIKVPEIPIPPPPEGYDCSVIVNTAEIYLTDVNGVVVCRGS